MKRIAKAWQLHPRQEYQIRIAHWFADLKGYYIDDGSWIHGPSGKPVAQGWKAFYDKYRTAINELVWGLQ